MSTSSFFNDHSRTRNHPSSWEVLVRASDVQIGHRMPSCLTVEFELPDACWWQATIAKSTGKDSKILKDYDKYPRRVHFV